MKTELTLEIIYKSDQETKGRKLGLELDIMSWLTRSVNAFDLMKDRVSKEWSASLSVEIDERSASFVFKMAHCKSRSWQLSFLLNWCEPVLSKGFVYVPNYGMLQVWTCLELPALKRAENCWQGSVLICKTCQ